MDIKHGHVYIGENKDTLACIITIHFHEALFTLDDVNEIVDNAVRHAAGMLAQSFNDVIKEN